MDWQNELNNKLDKISRIFIFAQEAYLYTEYFHNPSTKEELELITNSPHNRHLSTIMHLMFRSTVVEIYKLYDNDKLSLINFIETIKPGGHYRKSAFPIDKIDEWENEMKAKEESIKMVKILRDKIYAHTDDPTISYNNLDVSFQSIKSLLDLAEKIIKEVYKYCFNTNYLANPLNFEKERFNLLQLLAKAEKERKDQIINSVFGKVQNK